MADSDHKAPVQSDALELLDLPSLAFDAVCAASHPSPEDGGPCATCAFRSGTQASESRHTVILAKLCVEGLTPFQCHEQPQLCRGFIAACNLRGPSQDEDHRRHTEAARLAADLLGAAIDSAVDADKAAAMERQS